MAIIIYYDHHIISASLATGTWGATSATRVEEKIVTAEQRWLDHFDNFDDFGDFDDFDDFDNHDDDYTVTPTGGYINLHRARQVLCQAKDILI